MQQRSKRPTKNSLWTRGYLFFTSEDAFEGGLVEAQSFGVTSVPTLDRNCRLVHLLNKPSHAKQLRSVAAVVGNGEGEGQAHGGV